MGGGGGSAGASPRRRGVRKMGFSRNLRMPVFQQRAVRLALLFLLLALPRLLERPAVLAGGLRDAPGRDEQALAEFRLHLGEQSAVVDDRFEQVDCVEGGVGDGAVGDMVGLGAALVAGHPGSTGAAV